jgi:pantoate--beta-alanine ligase
MKVFRSIEVIRAYLSEQRNQQKKIGLIPTMGALHDGHLALVEKAKESCDLVLISIFVNPAQFNNSEDLEKYPRNIELDLKLLQHAECDIVFTPSVEQMYESKSIIKFNVGYLDNIMEGRFRPGHFSGVGLVVSKLFNIIDPDISFFGQKDLQQLVLINILAKELNFRTEIVGVATVREASGLAKSSRNQRLNAAGIKTAKNIYKGLKLLKSKILSEIMLDEAVEETKQFYNEVDGFELEYLEVVKTNDLESIHEYNPEIVSSICIAGYVAGIRLLDNICIQSKE